jgi:hypothetical protein
VIFLLGYSGALFGLAAFSFQFKPPCFSAPMPAYAQTQVCDFPPFL